VFAWEGAFPAGGLNDLLGSVSTEDEARKLVHENYPDNPTYLTVQVVCGAEIKETLIRRPTSVLNHSGLLCPLPL
jgi:hypothetical protein